ncbi:tetratricopeptide repeat protein [Shinella kummerowiae]|uniref:tetratricopeptide repeat protein n=1 Tax=Shinella kummerowiae TaxID=417745 RepID=UPI0021B605B2|nr:tetratricopeptide repeat protein [Shinella kummerowiae]MCT7665983.1 tetratricopeptide repeat protein [Shinella kummerowiae]
MKNIPDILHFEANPESDKLLVYFSSVSSRTTVGQSFFGENKINKLFLRDPGRSWFNGSIPNLSKDADDLADVIRQYAGSIPPENIVMSGSSMGGYASILFGCLLGAGKVVAVAPQLRLHPSTPYSPKKPVKYADLYPIITARNPRTKIELWYGTEEIMDLYHNVPAWGMEGILHRPQKGSMHSVLNAIKKEGRVPEFFQFILKDTPFSSDELDLSFIDNDIIAKSVKYFYIDKNDSAVIDTLTPIADTYDLSAIHHMLGLSHYRAGNLQIAERSFEAAIRTFPGNYSAHYYMGMSSMDRKDYAQAERYFASTIENFPSPNALRHAQLGAAQRLLGKLDEAKASHLHALTINPAHYQSHFELGLIYQDQGLLQDAVASFEQHRRLRPDSDAAKKQIGRLQKQIARDTRKKIMLQKLANLSGALSGRAPSAAEVSDRQGLAQRLLHGAQQDNAEPKKGMKAAPKQLEAPPEILFNPTNNSPEVTILLGFAKYMFRGFQRNNIQMKGDWYLEYIDNNIDYLSRHIRTHNLSSVNMIGTSKSCTGAFIFSHELAKRFPDVKFNVFAFSAYTTLDKAFYDERQLQKYLPGSLLKVWDNPEKFASPLARYGDSARLAQADNISLVLLYPEFSRGGEAELAKRMQKHANARFLSLPVRTHSIIAPFWHKLLASQEIEVFEGVVRPLPAQDYAYFSSLQNHPDYTFDLYHLLEDTDRFIAKLEEENKDYVLKLGRSPY